MTIQSAVSVVRLVGNGVLLVFSYPFVITDTSHLEVSLDGVVQGSGFTVVGVSPVIGGTCTFDVPPASGVVVTLRRVPPATQLIDYITGDTFPAASHEAGLDNATALVQLVLELFDRSVQIPVNLGGTVNTMLPAPLANAALAWDNAATGLTNTFASTVTLSEASAATVPLVLAEIDVDIATLESDVAALQATRVLKAGDTMTGNLIVQKAETLAMVRAESTDNDTHAWVDVRSKTADGTVVDVALVTDKNGSARITTISNHPLELWTHGTRRLAISAAGGLTHMPVGFQSTQQAIVSATLLTIAHGLGAKPKQVWVTIVSITTEYGFGVGEEVSPPVNDDDGGTNEKGVCVSWDATNIYIQKGNSVLPIYQRSNPGIGANITNANWEFIARANP